MTRGAVTRTATNCSATTDCFRGLLYASVPPW